MEQNNYFCPYTKNKKFENFVRDLLELKLENEETVKEVINYYKMVETFYTDKVAE